MAGFQELLQQRWLDSILGCKKGLAVQSRPHTFPYGRLHPLFNAIKMRAAHAENEWFKETCISVVLYLSVFIEHSTELGMEVGHSVLGS